MQEQTLYDGSPLNEEALAKIAATVELLTAVGGTPLVYYDFDGINGEEDQGPNGYDLPASIGSRFLDTGLAGERWIQRADSIQSVSAPLAESVGAVSVYMRSRGSSTGQHFFGCAETDMTVDPCWGVGRATSSSAWALYDQQIAGVASPMYDTSRTTLIQATSDTYTICATRSADGLTWKFRRQGVHCGRPLNQPGSQASATGSKKIFVGGSGSAKLQGACVAFDTEHDEDTARVIEYILTNGRLP